MTTQEQNELLAQWSGLECRCQWKDDYGGLVRTIDYSNCPRHSNGGLPPDYDRDEVAVGLLKRIIDKKIVLENRGAEWCCSIIYDFGCDGECYQCHESDYQPTIAVAIKTAVLALIDKEEKEQ